jgi:hypothetical protein
VEVDGARCNPEFGDDLLLALAFREPDRYRLSS